MPLLYSQGLKCGVTRSDFEIIVPGSQVPDCTSSKGFLSRPMDESSLSFRSDFTTTDAVSKTLLDNPRTVAVSMSVPLQTLAGTDHLWDESHEGFTIKVKECGLRPVYDSDVEEFIRASNNLSSNTRPEVLDPDRLAVTSTIIKRSCDYCSDQQPYPKRLK
ncbi:hypothetical protein Pint_07120 [Pistacia integerrima]|uniref:Uncharacterized protein n=1 Tax=Pistacia integerrima TaxID=434235 RepID=A0ACC0XS49_9ROSI|nr:hypothetical protein Pint_07120 [Pistacia integerrima]